MKVAVLGAGSMGNGIAHVSALGGHSVIVRDIEQELVEKGLERIEANLEEGIKREKITPAEKEDAIERITGTVSLEAAVEEADFVIEAVPEQLDLKQDVFEEVEEFTPDDAVVATNTSSLSVTEIASVLEEPSRCIGLHFFNPAHIMPLVEIVVAEQTSADTKELADHYVESIGKTPTTVNDVPGFASSRLGAMFSLEAIRMAQEGVASIEDIDETMRLGYNLPMGPIELVDHTGVDVNVEVMEYLREELGERFKPPQLLKRKLRAGKLGRKTGEGFYVWEDGEIVGVSGEE
ncbi:3-hydroxyacyl-CoA dehydrogenase family protein [Natrinema sp. 1APR25-10V2]|uniref:3-hydroxyacyl-CoA dehydrogenase family protein n=1 Tax=Natrinema sp. 1APR25-10V2 TaxID=2951081 RepID=UPI002873F69A|nr:3-hydroxyacyl-CoA dehydrogenase family protein [Natrinema sp. 1APR25-10V2]MDS0476998.1 3-hydroxyacyl-CoA dehydrogenase family protein [Natrinema sp. 1APR25-10V2]